jgi:predicted Zn-dependent peptidase
MTVEVTRLANGLTVATDRMDSVETVSLGAWVRVGTRHERAELNGVAHFLEHMVFKGTERRSARDIAQEIEAVGGHLNAYTGRRPFMRRSWRNTCRWRSTWFRTSCSIRCSTRPN